LKYAEGRLNRAADDGVGDEQGGISSAALSFARENPLRPVKINIRPLRNSESLVAKNIFPDIELSMNL
jgi:hypothetical protein